MRETVAAAIWASDHDGACEWDKVPEAEQELYLANADAAFATITYVAAEQSWHMRPDEATEEMCTHHGFYARTYANTYRRMIAAAPKFEWDK